MCYNTGMCKILAAWNGFIEDVARDSFFVKAADWDDNEEYIEIPNEKISQQSLIQKGFYISLFCIEKESGENEMVIKIQEPGKWTLEEIAKAHIEAARLLEFLTENE